jgi:hypothetical protein
MLLQEELLNLLILIMGQYSDFGGFRLVKPGIDLGPPSQGKGESPGNGSPETEEITPQKK